MLVNVHFEQEARVVRDRHRVEDARIRICGLAIFSRRVEVVEEAEEVSTANHCRILS